MADGQPDKQPKRQPSRRKGVSVDMPGFEGEVSEDTAKTFMDHTGKSWNWVVVLFGVSLLILSICMGASWLISAVNSGKP